MLQLILLVRVIRRDLQGLIAEADNFDILKTEVLHSIDALLSLQTIH